jgi:hypothetical protein
MLVFIAFTEPMDKLFKAKTTTYLKFIMYKNHEKNNVKDIR